MFTLFLFSQHVMASEGDISQVQPSDIRISEIMTSPTLNPDAQGEFIEIYNASNNTIDLRGLLIENSSGDWIMLGGVYPSEEVSLPSDLSLQPTPIIIESHGYIVVSPNNNPSQNGGLTSSYDYPYGQLKLQEEDTLSLYTVDLSTLQKNTTALDVVTYIGSEGISISRNYMDPYNDIWCDSTSIYYTGTFGNHSGSELGTPGLTNDECPTAHLDIDGDGFSENDGDCNDRDHTIYPNAPEICDGIVNNCGQELPSNEIDDDGGWFC